MSSIHILYNHSPTARLRPHPELCCGFDIFNWTEVVHLYAVGHSVHAYTMIYTVRPIEIMVVDPPPTTIRSMPRTQTTDHRFYALR